MGRSLSVSSLNSNSMSSTGGNPNKPYDIKKLVSSAHTWATVFSKKEKNSSVYHSNESDNQQHTTI